MQNIILQHVESKIDYCADGEFEETAEEPGEKRKAPLGASLLLDALEEHPMIMRNFKARYHVRHIRKFLTDFLKERNMQPGDTEV